MMIVLEEQRKSVEADLINGIGHIMKGQGSILRALEISSNELKALKKQTGGMVDPEPLLKNITGYRIMDVINPDNQYKRVSGETLDIAIDNLLKRDKERGEEIALLKNECDTKCRAEGEALHFNEKSVQAELKYDRLIRLLKREAKNKASFHTGAILQEHRDNEAKLKERKGKVTV